MQQILSNGTVASVIAEDKRRSEFVHLSLSFGGNFDRAVVFGQFAGFGIKSCIDQKLTLLLGRRVRLPNALNCFEELF